MNQAAPELLPPDLEANYRRIEAFIERRNYPSARKLLQKCAEQYAAYVLAKVERDSTRAAQPPQRAEVFTPISITPIPQPPNPDCADLEAAIKRCEQYDKYLGMDLVLEAARAHLAAQTPNPIKADSPQLDPDMPVQELRLHMGELTASEVKVARAAIAWANKATYAAPKRGRVII